MSGSRHPHAGRRWAALAALCIPVLLISMDVSVLFFAVPFVTAELEPSATQLLWIFDVYAFVLAGLLLTMGAVGDRIGRRRLLLIGAVAFSLASLVAAWATSAEMLIAARALMGLGGATLMPSTLALIRSTFTDDDERSTAVGVWSATMAGGVAVGPLLSGFLLEHVWWGSVFLVNVPVMLVLVVVVPLLVGESRSSRPRPIDLPSAVLVLLAVLPFVYGVKELAADGSSASRLLPLVVGVLAAGAFVVRQRTTAHPMLDLDLLRRPGVSGSLVVNAVASGAVVGNAILLTQYLQQVLGLSPLRAALWSLGPSVLVGAAAPLAAALATRVGRPRVMAAALGVAAVGFMGMLAVQADSSVWVCVVPAATIAVGMVSALTLVADHVVASAPPDRASATAGFLETTSELANALGIAILGSVLNHGYRAALELPPGTPGAARESLSAALAQAAHLPADAAGTLLTAARTAYVTGMYHADVVAALVAAAAAVLALRLPLGRATSGPDGAGFAMPEEPDGEPQAATRA